MSRISKLNNGILFEMRDESVFIEPYGADVSRLSAPSASTPFVQPPAAAHFGHVGALKSKTHKKDHL